MILPFFLGFNTARALLLHPYELFDQIFKNGILRPMYNILSTEAHMSILHNVIPTLTNYIKNTKMIFLGAHTLICTENHNYSSVQTGFLPFLGDMLL